MNSSKLVFAAAFVLISMAGAQAANLASDNAGNAAYNDGWQTGDNGGSGFGAWTLNALNPNVDRNGFFIGDSSGNGTSPSGNINTSGRSWGMYANQVIGMSGPDIGISSATRLFTGGELSAGQTLLISMDNGFINGWAGGQGSVGFTLNRFSFFFASGDSEYRVGYGDPANTTGLFGTGIPFTDGGLDLAFTRLNANDYSLTVTPAGGSAVVINGTMPDTGGFVDGITLYNRVAGQDAPHNAFFNSMTIVPEPSTLALGLSAFLLLGLRRLARR
jgi:hypothetical protein